MELGLKNSNVHALETVSVDSLANGTILSETSSDPNQDTLVENGV